MRGVEGAIKVLQEVSGGAFASEVLRKNWEKITPKERSLTATLVYATLRRQGLWKHLLMKYCKRPVHLLDSYTYNVLIMGIAGLTELRYFVPGVLVNALIQRLKAEGKELDVGLANAIFHTIMREAPSYLHSLRKSASIRDLALVNGVPGWVAAQFVKEYGTADGKQLVRFAGMKTYLSLRLSPRVNRDNWIQRCRDDAKLAWASPSSPTVVRLASNPLPTELPGYRDGDVTPQTESSIMVGDILSASLVGERVLDMCSGRGVKSGQILQTNDNILLESWDLSAGRIRVAEEEARRLHVQERVSFTVGDALTLTPKTTPSTVFLDAPCTGSGTWGRHPEGKWRLQPEAVLNSASLQLPLLKKAVSLVAEGGVVVYSTCSLFREENEGVVAQVLREHPEMVELPLRIRHKLLRRGKPFGSLFWPALPWVDGFYVAVLKKRSA